MWLAMLACVARAGATRLPPPIGASLAACAHGWCRIARLWEKFVESQERLDV